MPGDPLIHIIGEEEYYRLQKEYPEVIEEVREKYGLDQSFGTQYAKYLRNTVKLDFGYSYINAQPVLEIVIYRMKWTLMIAIPSIIISAVLGGFLGAKAGWKTGGIFDCAMTPVFLIFNTIPSNCFALIFLIIFAYKTGWFPIAGMTSGGFHGLEKALDILWHMALPTIVLTIFRTSSNYLLMKSYVSQIKDEEYILTAVSKGLSQKKILIRHVVKNAMLPYITTLCMQLGYIFSGSMMVEVIFSWKGMGTLIYNSVNSKDYPTIQLCFLVISVCVIVFNFFADVLYLFIDPRVKKEYGYDGN